MVHVIADNMIELENRHCLDTWNIIMFTAGEHSSIWHLVDSFYPKQFTTQEVALQQTDM